MAKPERTDEDRKAYVAKVKEFVAGGKSVPDACKEAGVSLGNYYTWVQKFKSKKKNKVVKAPIVHHVEKKTYKTKNSKVKETTGMVVGLVMGTPEAVAEVYKNINKQ